MIVITPETLAKGVACNWKANYYSKASHRWSNTHYGSSEDIYNRLKELGDSITSGNVLKIIGNTSWTETHCTHCGAENVPVVVLGYSDEDTYLCLLCAAKAVGLLGRVV